MTRKRLVASAVLLMVLFLLTLSPAFAGTGISGNDVVVEAGEVIDDDVYVSGNSVRIDGTITGDLIAVGSTVIVNGTVGGDVMAAAQSVRINGEVGDDVRIGGMALQLGERARVADEVMAGGFSYESKAGSSAGGDLLFGGYQALIDGTVEGDVTGAAGALDLRGTFGGNVDVSVGADGTGGPSPVMFMPSPAVSMPAVTPGLTVGDNASIAGDLIYESNVEGAISPSARVGGEVSFEEVVSPTEPAPSVFDVTLGYMRQFVTLLIVGLGLLWVVPAWMRDMSHNVETKPLPSLGWGVVVFALTIGVLIALFVATIVLAVIFGQLTLGGLTGLALSVGGLTWATLFVGFIIFLSYIAQIVVSFAGGHWLLGRLTPESPWATGRVVPLVLGLGLFVILRALPYVGWLVGPVVAFLALGALWLWVQEMRAAGVVSPQPPVAPPAGMPAHP